MRADLCYRHPLLARPEQTSPQYLEASAEVCRFLFLPWRALLPFRVFLIPRDGLVFEEQVAQLVHQRGRSPSGGLSGVQENAGRGKTHQYTAPGSTLFRQQDVPGFSPRDFAREEDFNPQMGGESVCRQRGVGGQV